MNLKNRPCRFGKRPACLVGSALLLTAGIAAFGEVVDSSDAGFTVRNAVVIAAPAAAVYRFLVKDIGRWWDPDHTYSKNAGNLSLDDRAGGLFLEKLENGGSVVHMTVVYAAPGKALRMAGGMGPLQALAVSGSMTWQLTPAGPGTRLELVYAVGGYKPGGLGAMAPVVDKVLAEQLQRLKFYAEKN